MEKLIVLNAKEKAVYDAFPNMKGEEFVYITLEDLAAKAFGDQRRGTSPKSKGNSWVRNSMRRLFRNGLVKHKAGKSGQYAKTSVSLHDLNKDIAKKNAAKVAAKLAKKSKAAKKAA